MWKEGGGGYLGRSGTICCMPRGFIYCQLRRRTLLSQKGRCSRGDGSIDAVFPFLADYWARCYLYTAEVQKEGARAGMGPILVVTGGMPVLQFSADEGLAEVLDALGLEFGEPHARVLASHVLPSLKSEGDVGWITERDLWGWQDAGMTNLGGGGAAGHLTAQRALAGGGAGAQNAGAGAGWDRGQGRFGCLLEGSVVPAGGAAAGGWR